MREAGLRYSKQKESFGIAPNANSAMFDDHLRPDPPRAASAVPVTKYNWIQSEYVNEDWANVCGTRQARIRINASSGLSFITLRELKSRIGPTAKTGVECFI